MTLIICGYYPRRASCMDVSLAYVANYFARTSSIPQWTFLFRCALYSIHSSRLSIVIIISVIVIVIAIINE